MTALSPSDPCSFSCPEDCLVKRIDLTLDVDFSAKVLRGHVNLEVERKADGVDCLVLDTRDLTIHGITDHETGQDLVYTLGEPELSFGSKLEVKLPTNGSNVCTVCIKYETSPRSTALQWLRPEQTAGKRQPYLFSQCQAIHCRSLLPCQDTPAVKCPYTAKITAPREITVLMSALRLGSEGSGDNSTRVHKFKQDVPVPSYLIAIVGGDIESRDIGPRSKVWSEKEMVDQAAYEFAETEEILKTAESFLGPYVWTQYDLLVLPPSFPYGGMENPCLTFVTPTILAGDRSLADVVSHEVSHSWTGNLVTNCTFEHFWLNEGHTKFVERKIVAWMKGGEKYRHFLAQGGWLILQETKGWWLALCWLNEGHTMFVQRKIDTRRKNKEEFFKFSARDGWYDLQNSVVSVLKEGPYTKLVPDLKGVDPDDAFSTVPYEKGFTLLFHLETLLGGPSVFEPFLRAYIEKFKYQSINTQQWKDFLYSYFSDKESVLNGVDWDTWLYGVGMPPIKPEYDTSMSAVCEELATKWSDCAEDNMSQFSAADLKPLLSVQVKEFLSILLNKPQLPVSKVQKMEEVYQLNSVKNSEVRFKWLRLCLKSQWEDAIPLALKMATEQGRMKFTRPLYRDLYAWEKSRDAAIANFNTHRHEMHNTTASLVAKDLNLNE